jgi:hypothetical protein
LARHVGRYPAGLVPLAVAGCRPGRAADQDLPPRPQRRGAFIFSAGSPGNWHADVSGAGFHLAGQARLPDPRLAGHQDRPALACLQTCQAGGYDLEFPGPARERPGPARGPDLACHRPILRPPDAAGFDADILAIAGNPLDDLAAVRRLRAVYAGGRAVLPVPGSRAEVEVP